jgi:hypothetical protein
VERKKRDGGARKRTSSDRREGRDGRAMPGLWHWVRSWLSSDPCRASSRSLHTASRHAETLVRMRNTRNNGADVLLRAVVLMVAAEFMLCAFKRFLAVAPVQDLSKVCCKVWPKP